MLNTKLLCNHFLRLNNLLDPLTHIPLPAQATTGGNPFSVLNFISLGEGSNSTVEKDCFVVSFVLCLLNTFLDPKGDCCTHHNDLRLEEERLLLERL